MQSKKLMGLDLIHPFSNGTCACLVVLLRTQGTVAYCEGAGVSAAEFNHSHTAPAGSVQDHTQQVQDTFTTINQCDTEYK